MTESDWLASIDPAAMLRHLTHWPDSAMAKIGGAAPSDRKLRLFAVACCILGGSSAESMREYEEYGFINSSGTLRIVSDLGWAQRWAVTEDAEDSWTNRKPTLAVRAHLIRDIIGNPFRRHESLYEQIDVTNLPHHDRKYINGMIRVPWLTPTVRAMAETIYEERTWEEMPVLGDALEDAGCDCEELLRHCRGEERCFSCRGTAQQTFHYIAPFAAPLIALVDGGAREVRDVTVSQPCGMCESGWVPLRGPHARGCWALDLILGKE